MGSGGGKNPLDPGRLFNKQKAESQKPIVIQQQPQARGPVVDRELDFSQPKGGRTPSRFTTQQPSNKAAKEANFRKQADDIVTQTFASDQSRTKTLGVQYTAPERGSTEFNAAVDKEYLRLVQLDQGQDPGAFRGTRQSVASKGGRQSQSVTDDSLLSTSPKLRKKSLLGG